MKKLICLFALTFSLVLMNTSCKKSEDNVQPPKTLAEQYPDWTNLTWVSTNGSSDLYTYPKLNISISGNVINYIETETYFPISQGEFSLHYQFSEMTVMTVDGINVVTFSNPFGTTRTAYGVSLAIGMTILTPLTNGKITLTEREEDIHEDANQGKLVTYTYVLQKK